MEATSPDPRRDERARTTSLTTTPPPRHPPHRAGRWGWRDPHPVFNEEAARHRFGGANVGAAFFGWLVAVGMTALLTGILAVVATAVGYKTAGSPRATPSAPAGASFCVTAIVLLAVLLIAYYSGGYVAGRMSRVRRCTAGADGLGDRPARHPAGRRRGWIPETSTTCWTAFEVPRIPIPTDDITLGGIITAVAVLVGTLLAAMFGGTVGRRYHFRVDRAAADPVV